MNRGDLNIHLLLCAIAFAIGVLVYANILHVNTLHAAAGVIIGVVAVLAAF